MKWNILSQNDAKLLGKIQKWWVWIIFVLIVTFISGIFTITNGIYSSYNLYKETFGKQKLEEDVIGSLSAGQSIEHFKKNIGTEIMRKGLPKGATEYVFKRYTYYIQALTNIDGTVIFWSITSCSVDSDLKIEPKWLDTIRLQKSTFSGAFKSLEADIPDYLFSSRMYFQRGATANTFAYELVTLGNISAYQAVVVGVNDSCPGDLGAIGRLFDDADTNKLLDYGGTIGELANNKLYKIFRQNTLINTYGETAPVGNNIFFELTESGDFQIGVDRIRLRTIR